MPFQYDNLIIKTLNNNKKIHLGLHLEISLSLSFSNLYVQNILLRNVFFPRSLIRTLRISVLSLQAVCRRENSIRASRFHIRVTT